MNDISKLWRELLLYGGASTAAFTVDLTLLAAFVKLADMHYLPAAILSFISGALVSYLLCIRFVFKFRRLASAESEFGIFLGIGVMGLALNAVSMIAGVEWLNLHFMLAKIGAASVTFLVNFGLRKFVLFNPARPVDSATMGPMQTAHSMQRDI